MLDCSRSGEFVPSQRKGPPSAVAEPSRSSFVSLAADHSRGATMSLREIERSNRFSFILAATLIAGGLIVTGVSLMHLTSRGELQLAQTSPSTPSVPAGKSDGPAESMPGGTRPTTPAPEPARPSEDAQKAGAKPALPPAPAEKMGEPVGK